MAFWNWGKEDFVNRRRNSSQNHLLLVTARVSDVKQARMQRAGALGVLVVALLLVVWVLFTGVGAVASWLFVKNERFAIRSFDFHSSGRLTMEHLAQYAGLTMGQNLFAVDLPKVREKLESVPLIARVKVERKLPSTLVLNVEERIALARVIQQGRPVLPVDREGHLLSPPASPTLPAISGIGERGLSPGGVIRDALVKDALELLDYHDTTRLATAVPIASVDIGDPTQIVLTLRNGAKVAMGREHMDRRLNRLAEILRHADENDQEVESADLTVDRNESVRLKSRGTPPPVPPAATNSRPRSRHG